MVYKDCIIHAMLQLIYLTIYKKCFLAPMFKKMTVILNVYRMLALLGTLWCFHQHKVIDSSEDSHNSRIIIISMKTRLCTYSRIIQLVNFRIWSWTYIVRFQDQKSKKSNYYVGTPPFVCLFILNTINFA